MRPETIVILHATSHSQLRVAQLPVWLVLQNQQALALYNEAQQAMSQDDFETARQKLKQANQTDPQAIRRTVSAFRTSCRLLLLQSAQTISSQHRT